MDIYPRALSEYARRVVKLKLTIAYDGTAYAGWQVQKIGTGVQEKLELALAKLFPAKPRVHGSSRTDTGVHALGLVAHFGIPRTEFNMSVRKLVLAINAHLPEDIRVFSAARAPATFHARFDAKGKQYRYFVWNHPAMNPLLRRAAWHVPRPLEVKAIQAAAPLFVGQHDFQSFAANPGYAKESTVRTLTRCDVRKRGPLFTFLIEGDGFLYKMCRGIVGTLVQVGLGKFPANEVSTMLGKRDRRVAGMTAPAHGLVLWKVFYGKTPKSKNQTPMNSQVPISNPQISRTARGVPGSERRAATSLAHSDHAELAASRGRRKPAQVPVQRRKDARPEQSP